MLKNVKMLVRNMKIMIIVNCPTRVGKIYFFLSLYQRRTIWEIRLSYTIIFLRLIGITFFFLKLFDEQLIWEWKLQNRGTCIVSVSTFQVVAQFNQAQPSSFLMIENLQTLYVASITFKQWAKVSGNFKENKTTLLTYLIYYDSANTVYKHLLG